MLVVGNWPAIAVVYVSYLAVVSFTRRDFVRARRPMLIAAAVAWIAYTTVQTSQPFPVLQIIVPSLVLLAGYWLSGLFFVRPDLRLESRLQTVDDRVLRQSGVLAWFHRAPRAVQEYFELSYLLVYLAVPAGATALILLGHDTAVVGWFWTVVLLAEFACYGMLPWLQTRPPRVLESRDDITPNAGVRRLNLHLVNRASIQVNTLPSGHAAGAFATALAVFAIEPVAGVVFLVVALSISVATVLGRYHYVIDTVLGVLVALVVRLLI